MTSLARAIRRRFTMSTSASHPSSSSYLSSLFSLEGRTALVTGATRGIGRSMALALARAGADVVLVQRSLDDTKTRDEIVAVGRRAEIAVCDLADAEQVKALVGKVTGNENEGGMGLDIGILINCEPEAILWSGSHAADLNSWQAAASNDVRPRKTLPTRIGMTCCK